MKYKELPLILGYFEHDSEILLKSTVCLVFLDKGNS